MTTIKAGTLAHGAALTIEAELRYVRAGRQTIDHQTTDGSELALSIMGETRLPRRRDIETGGQILDDLRELLTDTAARVTYDRERLRALLAVWERWHLNDLRALCAHQSGKWDESPPCPVSGYKAGSAWLVEPLPEDVAETIRATFGMRGQPEPAR